MEGETEFTDNLTWYHHWYTGNIVTVSYGVQGANHWLRFPELADFRISPNAREIYCRPLPDIPQNTIRHLLLDQVLPRCMAHQGNLLLHASGVRTAKGTVLFTGSSAAGKSTLAGYFHQSGYPAVSDDCILMLEEQGHVKAISSYGGVRLWKDSEQFLFPDNLETLDMAHYSSKQRITLASYKENDFQKTDILAIIFLPLHPQHREDTKVMLKSLSMRDGYMEVLKQTYQLDVTDPQKVAHHAKTLGRVIPKIPLFQLSMPHDYSLLPVAKELILETVLAKSGRA